ncbi:hypothetical protein M758_UG325600 [Ceratodon purpureus]|nr:hypothetical protein M758_UG325600 [Ceratodon purpureus]
MWPDRTNLQNYHQSTCIILKTSMPYSVTWIFQTTTNALHTTLSNLINIISFQRLN